VVLPTPTPPPPSSKAPAPVAFDPPIRIEDGERMLIPKHPVKANGKVDVVVHFHGGHGIHWDQLGLNAVVVDFQKGAFSSPYTQFTAPHGQLDRWLGQVKDQVKRKGHGDVGIDRIALTGFSAGYAGVRGVLRDPAAKDRINTVVLLDSLHTGYGPNKGVDPQGMAPFVEFAHKAARGQTTMVVTHSEIVPPTFASTTQTADALIAAVGTQRKPYAGSPEPVVRPLTQADMGSFHVRGNAGGDKAAHIRELKNGDNIVTRFLSWAWK
jgi:hypothetical protein